MGFSNIQLRQYFLGNLDNELSDAISLQIIENPEFENELQIAEDELMEDFLEKQLSPEEENLFYTNFLICDDRINELKQLSLLKQYSQKITENNKTEDIVSENNFWTKFRTAFSQTLRPVTLAVSLLLIVVLAGIIWIGLNSFVNKSSRLEQEFANLNQKDFSNLNEYNNYSNLNLIPINLRDATQLPKLNIKNLTEKVFFRLSLPFEIAEKDLLDVEVLSNQKTIFSQNKIQIYKNQVGQEVRFVLPKTIFETGQYQIKIQNPRSNFAPIIYNFIVE